jgi:hypothetical protein
MQLTRGLIRIFSQKPTKVDVNSLPDLDDEEDVRKFVNAIKNELPEWSFGEEQRTVVEFLAEASERYEVVSLFGEGWVKGLNNCVGSDLLQNMLDATLSACEKNPQKFDVSQMQDEKLVQCLWKVLKECDDPMPKYTVLKIVQTLPEHSTVFSYLSAEPNRVNCLLETLKQPAEFLRNGKT